MTPAVAMKHRLQIDTDRSIRWDLRGGMAPILQMPDESPNAGCVRLRTYLLGQSDYTGCADP
jgi:hypothetical protein